MRCDLKKSNKLALRTIVGGGVLAVVSLLVGMLMATTVFAADFTNRIMAIEKKGDSGIQIIAEKEIGSRYTSYLLSKPPRVVFDFQGADISTLPVVSKLSEHPVSEIRVSHYESASVKSGRIELILTDRVPYKVKIDGNILTVDFTPVVSVPATPPVIAPSVEVKPPVEVKPTPLPVTVSAPSEKLTSPAVSILEVIDRKSEIFLRADGELDRCKSFALKNPSRYVVDCFGVTEKIAAKYVALSGPIKLIRIGNYPDKVRFVLEGDAKVIDKLESFPVTAGLSIRFDGKTPPQEVTSDEGKAPAAAVPGQRLPWRAWRER
jgi:hypothetical protein